MNNRLMFFLFLFTSGITLAQKDFLLNSLIKNEYAFSWRAGEVGTRQSFLEFIADDGILFRPSPVNGKHYLTENNKPSSGVLSWYPSRAIISRDGDLGFTSGPWEWKRDKDDSVAVAFGNFCTVWQRQSSGAWKFVIDFGNSNDKPISKERPLKYQDENASATHGLIKGLRRIKSDELILLDKKFSEMTTKIGAANAYDKFTNAESEILQSGSYPIVGKSNIFKNIGLEKKHYSFKPAGGKISSSKDLGFTYGELTVSSVDDKSSEDYYYMRVWEKEKNRWVIVAEVIDKIKK
ncbi:MAG: nuclear transport factor 2 family protein [Bacteroidetes bacterium]|nr:nuclear transport factor 2 family protein [Bacteroidota bacterium]